MNEENFKLFWYWINERHKIYLKRQTRVLKPWTEDKVLQTFKFTNAFRELDTGTVWLRENFREPHAEEGPLLIANTAFYRMFNWIPTAEAMGWCKEWSTEVFEERIKGLSQTFTNCHMTHGDTGEEKWFSNAKTIEKIFEEKDRLFSEMRRVKTLQYAFELMKEFHLIGPFISYEIVTDLRHTVVLEDATDINSWANTGPGAKRGLKRIFPEIGNREYLDHMIWLLRESSKNLHPHVPKLELRDIEHSLCEFDKWARAFFGEGRPRNYYPGV
jgi:hypothetical protein